MPTSLVLHVAAGALAIAAGALAVLSRKGGPLHLASGRVFAVAMGLTAVVAIFLAAFVPEVAPGAPPKASISIALLTAYLVATAWLTVRREPGRVGALEAVGCAVAAALTLVLVGFAVTSIRSAAPYLMFAALAALFAALDLQVILKRGVSGSQRIARHLWRMCMALFFATSFFFLGQQKVMPTAIRGSPILTLLAVTPLLVMAVWLLRIRLTERDVRRRRYGLRPDIFSAFAFKPRAAACRP